MRAEREVQTLDGWLLVVLKTFKHHWQFKSRVWALDHEGWKRLYISLILCCYYGQMKIKTLFLQNKKKTTKSNTCFWNMSSSCIYISTLFFRFTKWADEGEIWAFILSLVTGIKVIFRGNLSQFIAMNNLKVLNKYNQ